MGVNSFRTNQLRKNNIEHFESSLTWIGFEKRVRITQYFIRSETINILESYITII